MSGHSGLGSFIRQYEEIQVDYALPPGCTRNALTVSTTGSGTVSSNPAGIDCESDCTEGYPRGQVVTLTATPESGAGFVGWGGDCSGTQPSCQVTMSAARSVTATFGVPDFVVTGIALDPASPAPGSGFSAIVEVKNQGTADGDGGWLDVWLDQAASVGCGTNGDARTALGTVPAGWLKVIIFQNLTAEDTGSNTVRAFVDSACDTTESNENNNQATQAYTVGSSSFALTVSKTGSGTVSSNPAGIDCGSDCTESYASGQVVTLTAIPGSGAQFSGWGGACSGTATTCMVTMNAGLSVSATFIPGANYALNDTGIDWCADETTNNLPCPVDGYPGQDAQDGRDVTHNDDSDGHAGFSFTKLDSNGNALPASATRWSCVRDNVTELVWEVKTDDGGLRDKDWTYSWYNPDPATNGGFAGYADYGDNCFDSARCDTSKYVEDVNDRGLCGASDWREPSVDELMSIVNNDRVNPAIDAAYFPNT